MSAGQRSARSRAISEGRADEDDVKGPDSKDWGTTEIEQKVADEADKDVSDVTDDERDAAIEAVNEQRLENKSSSGSSTPDDKPLNSGDVDTNDPTEDRSGADQTQDPNGQAKKWLDDTSQQLQDLVNQAAEHTTNAADSTGGGEAVDDIADQADEGLDRFGDTIADALGDDSSEDSSDSSGDSLNYQTVILVIAAIAGIYLVTQNRGGA